MASRRDCSIILSLSTQEQPSTVVNELLRGKDGLALELQQLTPNMKNIWREAVARSYTRSTQQTHPLRQNRACLQRQIHTKYRFSTGYFYPRFGRSQSITVGLHSLELALFSLGASVLRGKAAEQRLWKSYGDTQDELGNHFIKAHVTNVNLNSLVVTYRTM